MNALEIQSQKIGLALFSEQMSILRVYLRHHLGTIVTEWIVERDKKGC